MNDKILNDIKNKEEIEYQNKMITKLEENRKDQELLIIQLYNVNEELNKKEQEKKQVTWSQTN